MVIGFEPTRWAGARFLAASVVCRLLLCSAVSGCESAEDTADWAMQGRSGLDYEIPRGVPLCQRLEVGTEAGSLGQRSVSWGYAAWISSDAVPGPGGRLGLYVGEAGQEILGCLCSWDAPGGPVLCKFSNQNGPCSDAVVEFRLEGDKPADGSNGNSIPTTVSFALDATATGQCDFQISCHWSSHVAWFYLVGD